MAQNPLPESDLCPDFRPLVFKFQVVGSVAASPAVLEPVISENQKKAVRALLRHGGYKPSGRGRPASESLVKAFHDGRYPTIHPVVDFFNWLSTETALPISVLDGSRIHEPSHFRLGQAGETYVFNPSGQELKLDGLLVFVDHNGPTGSPVKDAQRTKVSEETSRFLVVVWGTEELPESLARAEKEIADWLHRNPVSI